MEGHPRKHESHRESEGGVEKSLPEAGSRVLLTKQSIETGKDSRIKSGEGIHGILVSPIEIGKPILLKNGSRTSEVKNIAASSEGIRITTETSVYELQNLFSGLKLNSSIGNVSLPDDAQPPQLEAGSAPDFKARNGEKIIEVKIDRDTLKNVLIQSGNGVVHVVGERYVVLARVGGAHIPFYRSSSGTDGKKQGEWYPFFGHTSDWIIKGDIAADGSMNYLPEITEVQKILNEHLVLPDPGYLNRDFNMVSGEKVLYSVGNEIPMSDFIKSPEFKNFDNSDEGQKEYIKRVTGYDPNQLSRYHPSDRHKNPAKAQMVQDWMSEVLQGIHKAQKQ
jgi:hypothetical protein